MMTLDPMFYGYKRSYMSGLILFCHIKCDYAGCRMDLSDKLYSMLNWSAVTGCKGNE